MTKQAREYTNLQTAVSRVSQYLQEKRRGYGGSDPEFIHGINFSGLHTADVEVLLAFAKDAERELGSKTVSGTINPLPFQSVEWLDDRETLVVRYKTPWKDSDETAR